MLTPGILWYFIRSASPILGSGCPLITVGGSSPFSTRRVLAARSASRCDELPALTAACVDVIPPRLAAVERGSVNRAVSSTRQGDRKSCLYISAPYCRD